MKIGVSGKSVSRLRARSRNSCGAYLLELLAALTVAGLFAVAIAQGVSQTKMAAFMGHGSVLQAALAQETIERLRSLPWWDATNFTAAAPLTDGQRYYIKVNSTDANPPNSPDAWQLRPLVYDLTASDYSWVSVTKNSAIPMTVYVDVARYEPYSSSTMLQCTVNVISVANSATAPYSVTILISKTGVHSLPVF